jgi:hypothetical protein
LKISKNYFSNRFAAMHLSYLFMSITKKHRCFAAGIGSSTEAQTGSSEQGTTASTTAN